MSRPIRRFIGLPACRQGFTLIELILVMVVVSTVLAISAPELRGFFASRKVGDSARMVLVLTKAAHSQSVVQGQPVRLNIDAEAGECWLTIQQAGVFVPLVTDAGDRLILPDNTTISLQSDVPGGSNEYIEFFPNGRRSPGSIELKGQQGERFEISCPSATEEYRVTSTTGGL